MPHVLMRAKTISANRAVLVLCALSVPGAVTHANRAADAPVYEAEQTGRYFQEWLLCGPFPNTAHQNAIDFKHGEYCIGFQRDFLESSRGETKASPHEGDRVSVPDLNLERRWIRYRSKDELIRLNDVFDPNDLVAGYGYCEIHSKKVQKAILSFGCNDGGKVWLNGELVHTIHLADGRWLTPDDDYVPLSLRKGINRLLVKIDEGSGDYGFVCRLLDYDRTIDEIRNNLEENKKLTVVTKKEVLSILFGTPCRIEVLVPHQPVIIEIEHETKGIIHAVETRPGFEVTVPRASIPKGYFTVRASLKVSPAETIVSEKRHFEGLLPRHALPQRLGRDLAMRNESGKPYFPIGTYISGTPPEEYSKLREAGYDFIVAGTSNLDAAQAAGLKVGVGLHGSGDDWVEHVRQTVREYKNHPAVMFWMMFDEPGYNRADLLQMHEVYQAIHAEDGVHPAYLVITVPEVYDTFGRCCDVLAIDTYPVSRGSYSAIGDWIDRAYRISDGDQPVWHCGQLFNWPADRYPTPDEHRMMSYLAVLSGVKAMLWFSYEWEGKTLPEAEPELWQAQVRLIKELKELEPVLVYPGLGERLNAGCPGVRATYKQGPDGQGIVVAVNTDRAMGHDALIQLPSRAVATLPVMGENREVNISNGVLQDRFEPLDVHVYQWTRE